MKALFIIAPVAILIAGILPSMAYILDVLQYPSEGLLLTAFFVTLIMIVAIVIGLVVTRTRLRFLTQPLYSLLGTLTIGSTVTCIYWIVEGVLRLGFDISGERVDQRLQIITGVVWIGLILRSIYQFHKPHTIRTISLPAPQLSRSRRFVYLADIQLGSTTKEFLETVIQTVNDLEPEFILFGGDIVDADYYESSDFEILSKLQVPFYFITGNHEYYHDAARVISYIQDYPNVHIMDNQTTDLGDGLELITIDYRDASSQTQYESDLDELQPSDEKFNIFMFHEPKRVEMTAEHGYDLQLYGHTHAGQMFPGNLFARLVYGAYAYGLTHIKNQKTNTRVYTTMGAGLWGPRMRLGSVNEIVVFELNPN